MPDDSLLKYTRKILLRDSINSIFKSYIRSYNLETKISNERLEEMIDHFIEIYKDYIDRVFEELDLMMTRTGDVTYLDMEELMTKMTGIIASRLVVELLLLDILRREGLE